MIRGHSDHHLAPDTVLGNTKITINRRWRLMNRLIAYGRLDSVAIVPGQPDVTRFNSGSMAFKGGKFKASKHEMSEVYSSFL
eukprot:scaffold107977_cov36-Cyclotella_meneghiniana.AAC.2